MANIPIIPADPSAAPLIGQGLGQALGGMARGKLQEHGYLGGITAEDIKAMDPSLSDEEAESWAKAARNDPKISEQILKNKQKQQQIGQQAVGLSQSLGVPLELAFNVLSQDPKVQKTFIEDILQQGSAGNIDFSGDMPKETGTQTKPAEINTPYVYEKAPVSPDDSVDEIDRAINQTLKERTRDKSLREPTNLVELRNKGMSKDEAKEALKEANTFYKDITKEAKGAKEMDKLLDSMEKLTLKNIENPGTLRSPATAKLLNNAKSVGGTIGAGLGALGSLLGPVGAATGTALGGALGGGVGAIAEAVGSATATPETQLFEKNAAQFLKGAKAVLGGRFSEREMDAYLKMFPSLMQTDEGKLEVIKSLREMNNAIKTRKEVTDRIIKANNGKRPYNLDIMVDDIAEPIIEKAQQSINSVIKMGAKQNEPQKPQQNFTEQQAQSLVL